MSLETSKPEILAIIGQNGGGKMCVLNCINGFYHPQQGTIYFDGHVLNHIPSHKIAKLGISRTFQKIELYTCLSILDNIGS